MLGRRGVLGPVERAVVPGTELNEGARSPEPRPELLRVELDLGVEPQLVALRHQDAVLLGHELVPSEIEEGVIRIGGAEVVLPPVDGAELDIVGELIRVPGPWHGDAGHHDQPPDRRSCASQSVHAAPSLPCGTRNAGAAPRPVSATLVSGPHKTRPRSPNPRGRKPLCGLVANARITPTSSHMLGMS